MSLPLFLNSSFFLALTTSAVGYFAIYLYQRQKRDKKQDIARLILQEIRYAELKVRRHREFGQYKLYDKLLPTNSWNDNLHLFINELSESEVDLISDFYSKSSYLDVLIRAISDQRTNIAPSIIHQNTVNEGITPPIQNQTIRGPMIIETQITNSITQGILNDVSLNFVFIYNTPTVERLRFIATKRKNNQS